MTFAVYAWCEMPRMASVVRRPHQYSNGFILSTASGHHDDRVHGVIQQNPIGVTVLCRDFNVAEQ